MSRRIEVFEKQKLIERIHQKALQFGDFTLASGQKAKFYLDCRKLTLDSVGANLVAEGILDLLGENLPDAVGGMAIGADPITAAVITIAHRRGKSLRGFIVRKESKGHGTGRDVEGPVEPGDTAVVVEDVITTGGSALAAIDRAQAFGLKVREVIGIVDRLQGGASAFAARNIPLRTLLTIQDLGIETHG